MINYFDNWLTFNSLLNKMPSSCWYQLFWGFAAFLGLIWQQNKLNSAQLARQNKKWDEFKGKSSTDKKNNSTACFSGEAVFVPKIFVSVSLETGALALVLTPHRSWDFPVRANWKVRALPCNWDLPIHYYRRTASKIASAVTIQHTNYEDQVQ